MGWKSSAEIAGSGLMHVAAAHCVMGTVTLMTALSYNTNTHCPISYN